MSIAVQLSAMSMCPGGEHVHGTATLLRNGAVATTETFVFERLDLLTAPTAEERATFLRIMMKIRAYDPAFTNKTPVRIRNSFQNTAFVFDSPVIG